MWTKLTYIIVLVPCFIISCATDSDEDKEISFSGSWQQEGLMELEINNINLTTPAMLVSTDEGLYSKEESFELVGLQHKEIVDVVWMENNDIIAAIKTDDFTGGDTTIYKKEPGENWIEFINNYGGENGKYTWVSNLEVLPESPNILFASGGAHIAKSDNSGNTWQSVFKKWETIGFTNFLKVDSQGNIWAGGENAIFEPTLLKSEDGGNTWDLINILENVEAANNDFISKQDNNNNLMIGLSGSVPAANIIRRSTDNGETWETVFEGAGIYTFTQGPSNSETVYASGRNSTGTLFFLASEDFGDNWQTIEFEDSPGEMYVNDMVSVLEDGEEVLYLGTNKGLYSYTFEE